MILLVKLFNWGIGKLLKVNDRVKTPHGTGTINGFEYAGEHTTNILKEYYPDTCLRIEIKLDIDNTWSSYPGNPLYYCNAKELELL